MQNKANFRNDKMNINSFVTNKYEILPAGSDQKTKPIQTQFKPNQSQFWAKIKGVKAKTNPIQTQFKPKQSLQPFHLGATIFKLRNFTATIYQAGIYKKSKNILEFCCITVHIVSYYYILMKGV